MKQIERLVEDITQRITIHLKPLGVDLSATIPAVVPPQDRLLNFYAFYGVSPHHPMHMRFGGSSLAGSYFLGKCRVERSIVYKSDVRGDELRTRGERVTHRGVPIELMQDEAIHIQNSLLVKTLVHNYSHTPASPEVFLIKDSVTAPFANIHGTSLEGCYLEPFATADLSTLRNCTVGRFAYVQAGELHRERIAPGRVWIRSQGAFEFDYRFPAAALERYVGGGEREPAAAQGVLMDFIDARKEEFQRLFDVVDLAPPTKVHTRAALNRYAVAKGRSRIGENVLVAQRAYLDNAVLGKGANAQENCYVIDSELAGNNVTAHGAKIIHTRLGRQTFVGFNAFLHGTPECPLQIGPDCIVMPHTLIDLEEPLTIPAGRLVWGWVRNRRDLDENSRPLAALARVRNGFERGRLAFRGSGRHMVQALQDRIGHILEANGAYFDGKQHRGHAQEHRDRHMVFNIIQPYRMGPLKGLTPTIEIQP